MPPEYEPIAGERHDQRSSHHEDEARIEASGEIQEVLHLGGVCHARDQKPDAEDKSGCHVDEVPHHQPPITWRMIKTVTKAVAMKMQVAAIERGESRAMPHTPCPLVQPPPKAVP